MNFPSEIQEKLELYVALLEKWNAKINLVSRETLADVWNRHVVDCAQLAELIPVKTTSLADMGSGAGLPGVILAILMPNTAVHLIERDQRKCSFLQEAIRQLELKNVSIHVSDVSEITDTFAVITARALASLSDLLGMLSSLSTATTKCYFPKGRNFAIEIEEAKTLWNFDYQTVPSKTSDGSVVLVISNSTTR